MTYKQSPPLTEDEIRSVYRNEFYTIDDPRYFPRRPRRKHKYVEDYFRSIQEKYDISENQASSNQTK